MPLSEAACEALRSAYGADAIVDFSGPHEFLSNFARGAPVALGGVSYPTAEQAFQSQKVASDAARRSIAAASRPSRAKALARAAAKRGDVVPGWFGGGRDAAMAAALKAKVRSC
jgi:predicted NAD-dependent protein-ADP-ribosyltransferase YbiA (DUF1768 family)